MAQLPTPMIATRTLSFARAPFFEPFVLAMSFLPLRLLCAGTPSPSASAARMTSFALESRARRLGLDLVLQLLRDAQQDDWASAC